MDRRRISTIVAKKPTPDKKEKLTTYYSIKKRYGQTLAVIISSATLLARGYN
jgi:hypothetical protein